MLWNVIIRRSGPQPMTQKRLVHDTTQHEEKITGDTLETLDQLLPKAALTWDFLIHK